MLRISIKFRNAIIFLWEINFACSKIYFYNIEWIYDYKSSGSWTHNRPNFEVFAVNVISHINQLFILIIHKIKDGCYYQLTKNLGIREARFSFREFPNRANRNGVTVLKSCWAWV